MKYEPYHILPMVEMPTEERRLVAEEGSYSKNTWLQKKEGLTMVGELLYRADHCNDNNGFRTCLF